MASSTIQTISKPVAATQEMVAVRSFPQLDRHTRLPSNTWRALYARATNNRLYFKVLNRRYIHAIRHMAAPELTAAGERVASDLSANGIAFAEFSEFFEPRFFETIRACFEEYLTEFNRVKTKAPKGKEVFLDTIHKAHTFVPDDPVSTYLAAPIFAATSARYMGMVPRFVGSSFWRTRVATGDDRMYSQQWHRDYNDRVLVKVFLYITDVGAEEGYFEYLTGSHGGGRLGRKYDRIGPDGFRAYPDASRLDPYVASLPVISLDAVPKARRSGTSAPWHRKSSVIRCLAPRATLIFADTFGLHRGGYVRSGYRDMIMTTYSTNFNVHKPHFAVTRDFARSLSPFMRMSFGIL